MCISLLSTSLSYLPGWDRWWNNHWTWAAASSLIHHPSPWAHHPFQHHYLSSLFFEEKNTDRNNTPLTPVTLNKSHNKLFLHEREISSKAHTSDASPISHLESHGRWDVPGKLHTALRIWGSQTYLIGSVAWTAPQPQLAIPSQVSFRSSLSASPKSPVYYTTEVISKVLSFKM